MNNFVRRVIGRSLALALRQNYGELVYTQTLAPQSEFPKVHTYRAMDLDGNLLDRNVAYDPVELAKILRTMIFVDEMDTVLLKVKGQGTFPCTQERSPST